METKSDVALAAQAFYEANLKSQMEPEHTGKFLVIDVTNQDYEMDAKSIDAFHRIMARHPEGKRFLMRIGYKAAHRMISFRPVHKQKWRALSTRVWKPSSSLRFRVALAVRM